MAEKSGQIIRENSNRILEEYNRFQLVAEGLRDVIWEMDKHLIFTFVTPTIKAVSGYTVEEMLGRCILDFLTEESREFLLSQVERRGIANGNFHPAKYPAYDLQFICKDGRVQWNHVTVKAVIENNEIRCIVGTTRDITEQRQYEERLEQMLREQWEVNARLEELLTYDQLTGAFHRRKVDGVIEQGIEAFEADCTPFSILMFDVDNFKRINDLNGHVKGDGVLQKIAGLIMESLQEGDKLFRWGGDEFLITLPGKETAQALEVAETIRARVNNARFKIAGESASISIGAGGYQADENVEQFVARVDTALINAKNSGKNTARSG
ncbi:MAG: diguanylate cyclase [Oscillospiraceae bacterium]